MVRKLCVTSVLFMLLVGSSALAQVQYGSLDGLVGEVVFYYEWAPTGGTALATCVHRRRHRGNGSREPDGHAIDPRARRRRRAPGG